VAERGEADMLHYACIGHMYITLKSCHVCGIPHFYVATLSEWIAQGLNV
jgi:hypothetical protein